MGLLDFFKSGSNKKPKITIGFEFGSSTSKDLPEYKDERKAECPYCHAALKKIPGSKTKCIHCGKYMFVRTSILNVRTVITKEESEKIDEQWSIHNGTHEQFLAEKKEFNDKKEELKEKFRGREPSENDVKWSLSSRNAEKSMFSGDWGSYRWARAEMVEILRKENKLDQALNFYLEICYLDANGLCVYRTSQAFALTPSEREEIAPLILPGIINGILSISKKLSITNQELQEKFFKYNERFEKMNFPTSLQQAWVKIEGELKRV